MMISLRTRMATAAFPVKSIRPAQIVRKALRLHRVLWVCLLFACVGASWFSYQCILVPQPAYFEPDWHGARWVQARDGYTPVAYFRYTTSLNVLPDTAFVTIAASQVFQLYVNGSMIGSNKADLVHGDFPRAYIYDVTAALQAGANVIAARVANVDEHMPGVIISFGAVHGGMVDYHGTGNDWLATTQSNLVHPRFTKSTRAWANVNFAASAWLPAHIIANPPASPLLAVNPQLYQRPVALRWMNTGSSHEAYFVRHVSLPFGFTDAWLRLAATGTANVFINGHLYMTWDGQATIPDQNIADYLSDQETFVQYQTGLALGVYDISPYLHPGLNTVAVHVLSPGTSNAQLGLEHVNTSMSLDMLVSDVLRRSAWVDTETGWHASSQAVAGWSAGNIPAFNWPSALVTGRPGVVSTFYVPDHLTTRNVQLIPLLNCALVLLLSCGLVIGSWLLMSLIVMRSYYSSRIEALEATTLAYLPALAGEALLVVLSREPQVQRPFPYTSSWGIVLIALVLSGYLLLWFNAHAMRKQRNAAQSISGKVQAASVRKTTPWRAGLLKLYRITSQPSVLITGEKSSQVREHILKWLREYWPVVLLTVLVIPLVGYNLPYEPYWQDELSSYYASRGVLAHGLPFFPSGFLYEKAELYSYLLALWTTLFGERGGIPRTISLLEYLASLPLLYIVGRYFFERRIALLATAMLAFSPISLVWSRQMRMYEQAQLLTLLVIFMFYKAWHERQHTRLIYLAVGCLVVDYLSHEEIFIILPALVLGMLLISWEKREGVPIWRNLPRVLYRKHWWWASIAGGTIIIVQLLAVRLSHPPVLGTDSSQHPLVKFTTDNISYYVNLFFFPDVLAHGRLPWITVNSLLAAAGCFWARRSTDMRAKYCALILMVSILTLVLAFTMQADRYIYPILPLYYLMGAYALITALRALWVFARPRLVLPWPAHSAKPVFGGYLSASVRLTMAVITCAIYVSVLLVPALPLSNYNLFLSKVTGLSYHRHYPDYDAIGQYMRQHWRKGDIVISVSPAISVLYYVHHVDYFFSIDRALFLFERDGDLVETSTGAKALLNQQDFQALLATNARIWIISDNGQYQAAVQKRFTFPIDFHIVYEGYGSAIYFRGT